MNNPIFIDPNKMKELIFHNAIIIDIRDEYEYQKQHIKTSINIPYPLFHLYKKRIAKDKPLYLICHYGKQSEKLAKELRKEGYQAYSFINGYYGFTHPLTNKYY